MSRNQNEDVEDVEDTQQKKRKRASNFQAAEDEALLCEFQKYKDLLNAAICNNVTFSKKTKAWKTITDRVNAVGGEGREVAKVKKRWEDLKRKAKEVHAGQRQAVTRTGGGASNAPPDFLHMDRIISIAGLTKMQGIAGGLDSHTGISDSGLGESFGLEVEMTNDNETEPLLHASNDPSLTSEKAAVSCESVEQDELTALSASPPMSSLITPHQKMSETAPKASCSKWSTKKGLNKIKGQQGNRKLRKTQTDLMVLDEEPNAFNSRKQESIEDIERERLELADQKLALLKSNHALQERMVLTLDGILKELQSPHSTFGQHLVAYALPSGEYGDTS